MKQKIMLRGYNVKPHSLKSAVHLMTFYCLVSPQVRAQTETSLFISDAEAVFVFPDRSTTRKYWIKAFMYIGREHNAGKCSNKNAGIAFVTQ